MKIDASRARRWFLVGGAMTSLVTVGVTHAAADRRAADDPPATPTAVVDPVVSQTPSISADGRYVVYAGVPTSPDDPRTSTVFLLDRATSSVTELTVPPDGVRPGDSVHPVLSADGCNVAVVTEVPFDLFRDDDEGDRWDVYTLRLPQCDGTPGDWQLVSTVRGAGFEASAADDASPLDPPAISGEGATIAYTHRFSVAAPELSTITVVDLTVPLGEPGRVTQIAGAPVDPPDSTFRYRGLREPSLSEDGSVLAFTSDADLSAPLGQWGTGPQPGGFATSNVYVWDRANTDRNTNVRRVSSGGATGGAGSPAVSGDGRYVAFVSTAPDVVAGAVMPVCNPDCLPQVYLYDRSDGSVELGSRAPGDPAAAPVAADLGATQPVLSRSGHQLFYVSRSTNLFPTRSGMLGGPSDGDIVVSVPATGVVQRVSTLADGVSPAPSVNAHPAVSANGRTVVFDTLAGAAFGNFPLAGRQVAVVDHPPVLALADLDVGSVAVGFPGPEWYLVVSNRGPSAFVPATVEVDNPDFIISGGSCVDQSGVAVPPGGVCTVHVMLQPSAPGRETGTLTVSESGFGAVSVSSELSGSGGEPALAPSPGGAEAHPVVVGGRDEPMLFQVGNVAFGPVKVKSVKVEGRNPDDFQIGTDECTGRRIDAGATCNVEVVFTPTASGRRTASVVVRTVEGAYTTMLVSGDAHYEPKLAVSATTAVAPTRLTVIGAGFAPSTAITVAWSDGLGRPVTVISDEFGGVLVDLVVRPNDRPGNRTLVAQTVDGDVATTDVMVVVPRRSAGAASPRWPGG